MVLCKDYNGPARVHKSGCNPTSCVPIWLFSIVADLEVSLTSVEITFPHYGQFNLEIFFLCFCQISMYFNSAQLIFKKLNPQDRNDFLDHLI